MNINTEHTTTQCFIQAKQYIGLRVGANAMHNKLTADQLNADKAQQMCLTM